MSDDLIIKISTDNKAAKSGIEAVSSAADKMKDSFEKASEAASSLVKLEALQKIGEVSKEVFDVFKEKILGSVEAYGEAEDASRRLTLALQNQGIYTTELIEDYEGYAKSVSELTGIQTDEIEKAQAVAQTFLGQTPVTEELTQAIADLAVQQGISLPQAAEEMGKAIGEGTGQLKRQGLEFAATDTEAERFQKTLEFVQVKAGGFAEAANQGVGSIKGLNTAFKDANEELGEKFAPAFEFVVKSLTEFVSPAEDSSEEVLNLKAALLLAGVALAAIGVALPIIAQGFVAVKAAAVAFEISAAPLLLIPVAIAAIVFTLTELYLHWDEASARITVIVKSLVEFVSAAFSGLGKILSGAFHLDTDKIKDGLKDIENAFKESAKSATAEIPAETEAALDEQEAIKKKYADKAAKDRAEQEQVKINLARAESDAITLELEGASQQQIDIKKQEVATLTALEKNKNKEQRELLKERYDQLQAIEQDQIEQDELREKQFADVQIETEKDLVARKTGLVKELTQKEESAIKSTILTEKEVQKKAYRDQLAEEIAANNKFLEEKNKYGVAYAAIDKVIHSSEVEGTKKATNELTGLTQSKNETLKAIGKAASVAQIIIKTSESAMNIYAGFSAIPFIGPALGVAGAAAAIAFGAEQISNVVAAQTGGIVPGQGSGDRIPALLEPGELIAPKKNFDEVINSVSATRQGQSQGGNLNVTTGIKVGFNGPEASRVITVRQNEDKALGISRVNS